LLKNFLINPVQMQKTIKQSILLVLLLEFKNIE
jgi:hypothetical protein